MKPYDAKYFTHEEPAFFSYDPENLRAAQVADGAHADQPISPLPSLERPLTVPLRDFLRFWQSPPAYFVEGVLGVRIPGADSEPEVREPLSLDFIEGARVGSALLEGAKTGAGSERVIATLRAGGALPPGALGDLEIAARRAPGERIGERVRELLAGRSLRSMPVSIPFDLNGPVTLEGTLDGILEDRLFDYRYSKLAPRFYLDSWLRNLVFCVARPDGLGAWRIGREGEDAAMVSFGAPENPKQILASLVGLFLTGHEVALPFLPGAAYPWAAGLADGADERTMKKLLDSARDALDPLARQDDPVIRRALSGSDLFDHADNGFTAVSQAVFGPLIAHMEGEG